MFRNDTEGMIYGFLNKNLIAFVCEALYAKINATDHTGYIGKFLTFQVHAKLFLVPATDIVPIGIVTTGIAQNALLEALLHGFNHKGRSAEVHISHPHGDDILATTTPIYLVVLHTVSTKARYYFREIVGHNYSV
jgi:hypothetical protein